MSQQDIDLRRGQALKCPMHPRYLTERPPVSDCKVCAALYRARNLVDTAKVENIRYLWSQV